MTSHIFTKIAFLIYLSNNATFVKIVSFWNKFLWIVVVLLKKIVFILCKIQDKKLFMTSQTVRLVKHFFHLKLLFLVVEFWHKWAVQKREEKWLSAFNGQKTTEFIRHFNNLCSIQWLKVIISTTFYTG
jgi:hypothetical protein